MSPLRCSAAFGGLLAAVRGVLSTAACGGLLLAACGGSKAAPVAPIPPPIAGTGPVFQAPNVWTQAVDGAALHADSAAMMARLISDGGFGGGHLQVDFSFTVLDAGATTPHVALHQADDYTLPDCDAPATVPLPPGGAIEGMDGYACPGGDCHLLVVDRDAGKLYETYQADLSGGALASTCTVVWDLTRTYLADLRGQQCTSADAAGLPIAPLLFSADELSAGSIDHAIRFILPNDHMRAATYVAPATHAGAPGGAADALPYGSRLRLKASADLSALSPAAQVVARALKKYGMILADGGNIALTARDDRFTAAKWDAVGFDSHSLFALTPSAFEVVDTTAPVVLTYDCVRN
jgi:serine/threonine-protein kinase